MKALEILVGWTLLVMILFCGIALVSQTLIDHHSWFGWFMAFTEGIAFCGVLASIWRDRLA